ncbi:hypothetical protein [Nocardioides sp. CER19]|uniref:hypothetical protein n=1 Tax=Nocardioides sp. CER19 TaxID=3038538 RepID=UPI0024473C5F|nr:hypothetical protein [Nocardioides sp. CER19]MDH2416971.1 hypothetical protein [Nocardioides sp. CER19]
MPHTSSGGTRERTPRTRREAGTDAIGGRLCGRSQNVAFSAPSPIASKTRRVAGWLLVLLGALIAVGIL